MNQLTLVAAIVHGLALLAIAVSLFALFRTKLMVCAAEDRSNARDEQSRVAVEALRRDLDACRSRIEELERRPNVPAAGTARAGLNLSLRSQALRMHRRGESVEQIATALEAPSQEVDLLIKVHRIVMDGR